MTREPGSEADSQFTDYYRQHYAEVHAYLSRRCSERDLVLQAVAETFTVAWRRLDEALTGGRPWLYRTARLSLNNALRTERRQDRVARRSADQGVQSRRGDRGAEATTVESWGVREVLGGLPERDQEVLMLAYWEDLAVAEVAAALGCSAGTAAVRLHRARARFKRAMAANAGPLTDFRPAPLGCAIDKESLT
ncbi:sigma-70 family RNA polymerase sigma factor [Nocardioides sp. 616]|uniref:RNA polymerase sigma factor n=1 Tax=Nocardioides sp. 616 TaxID=2268090 RepID=UPI000CE345DA|nr:sigma-70 family RNA polymerase sigma factor [Nocardioides sp. 616]